MENAKTSRWILENQNGIESLRLEENAAIPDLGEEDVLVEVYAASLNYRDLVITKDSKAFPLSPSLIPGSDGAGIILSAGSKVTSFRKGDKVVTHMVPNIPSEQFPNFNCISTGMGQQVNGTLTKYAVFPQSCLVLMPTYLSFEQAATLTCSGLTAWNAIMGLKGREVKSSDWVLIQGSGGVSVAALQFALAAGATVVATTSSDDKAKLLRALGAKHTINYRSDPTWGQTGKALTPDGQGFDIVVDVGGENTLAQSLAAIRVDGLVVAAGLVAGSSETTKPGLLDTLWNICIVRGILLGTRKQFEDMNRFIEEKEIGIAVDDEVFQFEDVKIAYRKLEAQRHFSKIVIKIK